MSASPLRRKSAAFLDRVRHMGSRGTAPEDGSSGLDRLIPPEIKGDRFFESIVEIASTPGVREILEIGSSSGDGSTEAWVRGALANPEPPNLHCIEVSVTRWAALCERWRDHPFVHCYNVSSVPLERFPSEEDVTAFFETTPSKLRPYGLETVLGWLRQDVDYVSEHDLSGDGIREIKERNGIDEFDAVLIDGSEFTGSADLDEVYGARFLLLDDTQTFKNWASSRRLQADDLYRLVQADDDTRNGFAVFERVR